MAHDNREIEIKLPLHNPEEVRAFLDVNAECSAKDVFQKDTYYILPHRDFLKKDYPYEWLRLRETAKWYSINYKHFYPENVKLSDYCDEFESKIENGEAMKKIFTNIDLQEAVVVEKHRTTWLFNDVEIVIDDVAGLWAHIELETTTAFDNPQEWKKYLYQILEKLNVHVGEVDLRWYPYRLLEQKWYSFGV